MTVCLLLLSLIFESGFQPVLDSVTLRAMKDRLMERSDVPPPQFPTDSLCAHHLQGLALETRFAALDSAQSCLQLCINCHNYLRMDKDKPKRLALANFLSRGE